MSFSRVLRPMCRVMNAWRRNRSPASQCCGERERREEEGRGREGREGRGGWEGESEKAGVREGRGGGRE